MSAATKTLSALALCALIASAPARARAQQLPAAPNPVAVTLDARSTVLLVMDVTDSVCGAQPRCTALVPRIAALIAAARKAGVFVLYSGNDARSLVAPTVQPPFLTALAPAAGDPVIVGAAQDRFFDTQLDLMLRKHGIATIVMAGWRENGSVLYTAVGAAIRTYTVVVPEDTTSASGDEDVAVGRYQLLTQLNANPKNEPLRKGAVTLSRTDLITFR